MPILPTFVPRVRVGGHIRFAFVEQVGVASTCASGRGAQELPGRMRIFAGGAGFETRDAPVCPASPRQLPKKKASLRCAFFTQQLIAYRPVQQPRRGYADAVPRCPRGGHGDCEAHRHCLSSLHQLCSLLVTWSSHTLATFARGVVVDDGRVTA